MYDHWSADLASTADYYPGGMMMPGRNTEYSWSRMAYNGKPKDDEVYGKGNYTDYGARGLDTRIMRWTATDPIASKYPHSSPFVYVAGNPIILVDPDGKDVHLSISSKAVGTTQIRLIGSENVDGAPATISVPVYELRVTDDVSKRVTTYLVTRDAPLIDESDPVDERVLPTWMGGDVEYNVVNTAFEPKADVGTYSLVPLEYPKGMGAYALRNPDGTVSLEAESNESPFRSKDDVATGVMIHVGGNYVAADGKNHTTGSEGCFTLAGKDQGNAGINNLVKDINQRRTENEKAGKGKSVDLKVEKRTDVKDNWEVDDKGEEVDRW